MEEYERQIVKMIKCPEGKWRLANCENETLSIWKGGLLILSLSCTRRSLLCAKDVVRLLEKQRKGGGK